MTAFFPDGLCEKPWGIYAAKSAQWAALVSQMSTYHRGALLTPRFMGTALHSKVINRKKLLPWRQLILLVKPVYMPSH